jgi:hypothetical protein
MFALQLLLATKAGGLDTSDDWARWLAEAGFNPARSVELPAGAGTTLRVAQKPAQ